MFEKRGNVKKTTKCLKEQGNVQRNGKYLGMKKCTCAALMKSHVFRIKIGNIASTKNI